MPQWTLGNIASRATTAIGRRADLSMSDVSWWVNEAYQFVVERAPHAPQEKVAVSSTTSGENRIDLPGDANEVINLSYLTDVGSSARTLRQTRPNAVDASGFKDLGVPDEYVLFEDWMELHPSPDSAYSLQIRYKSFNTDLTATSDVPSVSTPWRTAIYYKTKELLLSEMLDDPAGAASARNQFISYTRSLDDDYAKRQKASREAFGVQPYTGEPG